MSCYLSKNTRSKIKFALKKEILQRCKTWNQFLYEICFIKIHLLIYNQIIDGQFVRLC